MLGRLQGWLQGMPTAPDWKVVDRPNWVIWLGNRLSDVRYYAWRARGGRFE